MITAIVGTGGAGKTSFMVFKLQEYLKTQKQSRLKKCRAEIEKYNKKRTHPLSLPDRPPFYTNFNVTIPVGYKKYFSPYYLNPYYFGLPERGKEIQAVMPYGVMFFTETDKIYDSREKSLPAAVSGIYNKHRHFWLDVYIELHRAMNADTLIRANIHNYIEIVRQERETDAVKRIVKTTWFCREFEGVKEYLQYIDSNGNAKNYKETTYTHVGNIFKYYNSFECSKEFIPADGKDFSLLEQPSKIDLKKLPPDVAKFYNTAEPKDWRNKGS